MVEEERSAGDSDGFGVRRREGVETDYLSVVVVFAVFVLKLH